MSIFLVRFVLTLLQMTKKSVKPGQSLYMIYVEVYFEIPYNIFNIVSFIVLMQWVQLWATLYEIIVQQKEQQRETLLRNSNAEYMKVSQ